MSCTYLDMDSYPRKAHFDYFCSLAYPYGGLTVEVDVTDFLAAVKGKGLPFFLSLCYCVREAANAVPQLRQRILGGKIVEFDRCPTSHTVALPNGTYCYCVLDDNEPFFRYLDRAVQTQEKAKVRGSIEEKEEEALSLLYISCVPWISYTAAIQPVPYPADSNPRITWGKYHTSEGRVLLPVTVLCHHALVDGIHIAAFYDALDKQLGAVTALIQGGPTQ